jgi:hypothetical protein
MHVYVCVCVCMQHIHINMYIDSFRYYMLCTVNIPERKIQRKQIQFDIKFAYTVMEVILSNNHVCMVIAHKNVLGELLLLLNISRLFDQEILP